MDAYLKQTATMDISPCIKKKKKRNVTVKPDESVSMIHLGLCKLAVRHTHRTFSDAHPHTTDLCPA